MPEFPTTTLLDNLERNENPLSNGGRWTILPVAGVGSIGKCKATFGFGWVASSSPHCGAYWNVTTFKNPAVYMKVFQEALEEYWVALWACQEGENGYRLRLESRSEEEGNKWKLYLEKCVGGVFTVLGEHLVVGPGEGFEPGLTTFGLSVFGGKVKAWWKPAAEWEVILEVADATYTEGHLGLETQSVLNVFGSTQFHGGSQEAGKEEEPEPEPQVPARAGGQSTSPRGAPLARAVGGAHVDAVRAPLAITPLAAFSNPRYNAPTDEPPARQNIDRVGGSGEFVESDGVHFSPRVIIPTRSLVAEEAIGSKPPNDIIMVIPTPIYSGWEDPEELARNYQQKLAIALTCELVTLQDYARWPQYAGLPSDLLQILALPARGVRPAIRIGWSPEDPTSLVDWPIPKYQPSYEGGREVDLKSSALPWWREAEEAEDWKIQALTGPSLFTGFEKVAALFYASELYLPPGAPITPDGALPYYESSDALPGDLFAAIGIAPYTLPVTWTDANRPLDPLKVGLADDPTRRFAFPDYAPGEPAPDPAKEAEGDPGTLGEYAALHLLHKALRHMYLEWEVAIEKERIAEEDLENVEWYFDRGQAPLSALEAAVEQFLKARAKINEIGSEATALYAGGAGAYFDLSDGESHIRREHGPQLLGNKDCGWLLDLQDTKLPNLPSDLTKTSGFLVIEWSAPKGTRWRGQRVREEEFSLEWPLWDFGGFSWPHTDEFLPIARGSYGHGSGPVLGITRKLGTPGKPAVGPIERGAVPSHPVLARGLTG